MRRALRITLLLAAAVLGLGLLLPRQVEVRRVAMIMAPAETLLVTLATLPRGPGWAPWEPAQQDGLEITAQTDAGIWFDVAGPRRRRAAILVEATREGTRLVWSDVEHYRFDPISRILAAVRRDDKVGGEIERSISGLRDLIE